MFGLFLGFIGVWWWLYRGGAKFRESKSIIRYLRCQWRWYMVKKEGFEKVFGKWKKLKYLILCVNTGCAVGK